MRRKPAACSNALSPNRDTFSKALRLGKAPLSLRQATIFLASREFRPDTRVSNGAEAVFTSTPTAFTQSSMTASSDLARDRKGVGEGKRGSVRGDRGGRRSMKKKKKN